MTGQYDLLPVTISGAATVGMVLALLGSIKLALAQRLAIDETRVGGLVSALFFALAPMVLLSGMLIDAYGVKWVLIAGSVLAGIGLSSLALNRTYLAALGATLMIGAGGACLSSSSFILMPPAFFPANHSASFNLGNVFFGLGALLTPTLAELLIRRLGFKWALGVLALLSLIPAATASLPESFPNVPPGGDLTKVVFDPILWLVALGFFLYAPLENMVGTWATTLLTDLGFPEARAALLLSGFWLTFLAGRLLVALLQLPAATNPWVILGLAVAAAVALGNMTGAPRRGGAAWGLLLVGVFLGPIFPTLVAILYGHFQTNQGTAYGAMFALGAIGPMVLPPLMGAYARRHTVRKALSTLILLALLLAAAALVLGLEPRLR
jgi:fucose permease